MTVVQHGADFSELPLDDGLLQTVAELGFTRATPIQAAAIPPALEGRDVIGQAQTGSGKTAAFGLSVLQRLSGPQKGVQAVIIAPTRELAVQVTEEITRLAKGRSVRLLAAVGGHSIDVQVAALRHGVDVLVGTPGRILDLMYRGELDFGSVTMAVVDEADEMLKMGFVEDVEMILSCLPPDRQTLLFSATMPPPIRRLAEGFMRDPEHITVKNTEETLPDIDQFYLEVHDERRLESLAQVLAEAGPGRSIVFCRTKARVHQVGSFLSRRFEKVGTLSGDRVQSERDRTMRQFRRGQIRILVATDVVARGIDVQNVSCVINYDCPTDVDAYVHRVGRTARAGASGTALTFVASREMGLLKQIERRVGKLKRLEDPARLRGVAALR